MVSRARHRRAEKRRNNHADVDLSLLEIRGCPCHVGVHTGRVEES
jgi:hypothetical protein